MVNGARRIRSRKSRCLESKGEEWDESRNIEQMLDQVKRAKIESGRDVWLSEGGGGKPQKSLVELYGKGYS